MRTILDLLKAATAITLFCITCKVIYAWYHGSYLTEYTVVIIALLVLNFQLNEVKRNAD